MNLQWCHSQLGWFWLIVLSSIFFALKVPTWVGGGGFLPIIKSSSNSGWGWVGLWQRSHCWWVDTFRYVWHHLGHWQLGKLDKRNIDSFQIKKVFLAIGDVVVNCLLEHPFYCWPCAKHKNACQHSSIPGLLIYHEWGYCVSIVMVNQTKVKQWLGYLYPWTWWKVPWPLGVCWWLRGLLLEGRKRTLGCCGWCQVCSPQELWWSLQWS